MKLTRREILGIVAAAAAGVTGTAAHPQTTRLPTRSGTIASAKLRQVLARLGKSRSARGKLLANPDEYLESTGLADREAQIVRQRINLCGVVASALAFQQMKQRPSLRAILLNPGSRTGMLVGGAPIEGVGARDVTVVENLRDLCDDVLADIFAMDPGLSGIVEGPGQVGITNGPVECSFTGGSCNNTQCDDNTCSHEWCNNWTRCENNLGCSHDSCTNQSKCSNTDELCSHSNCTNNERCSKGQGNCDVMTDPMADEFYAELARSFDELWAEHADMDFLVRLGDTAVQGETLMDAQAFQQELANLRPGDR